MRVRACLRVHARVRAGARVRACACVRGCMLYACRCVRRVHACLQVCVPLHCVLNFTTKLNHRYFERAKLNFTEATLAENFPGFGLQS